MNDLKATILAIDDDPANLLTLGAALASEYDLRIATSGALGLRLAAQAPPDLILLDVMMPEMDGYETCRRLKNDPRLCEIPVVFVTALGDSDAENAGLAVGAADYITKPVNVGTARHRIRNLLERERLRKRDQEQRHRLEQLVIELKRASEGLEQTVAARTGELRSVAMELLAVEARERSAIAGDLHDDLGQNLAIAKLKLSSLQLPAVGESKSELLRQLRELEAIVDRSSKSVRSLSTQLSPPVLSQYGLGSALEWLAEEMKRSYGLAVSVDLCEIPPLEENTGNALYRIARELLINVWKHANVSTASVIVAMDAATSTLKINVVDEGAGFDAGQAMRSSEKQSYGLFSIGRRLDFIGGAMLIDSRPGKGTVVTLKLPLRPAGVRARNSHEPGEIHADRQVVCAASRAGQRDRYQFVAGGVAAPSQPVAASFGRGLR